MTGQRVIHPPDEESGVINGPDGWLSYLWETSLEQRYNTPAIEAFMLGYLTHAAGDMYRHTFVNFFTGGPFELAPPTPTDFGNESRPSVSYIIRIVARNTQVGSTEGYWLATESNRA